jgi:alpha-galactosidase
LLGNGGDIEVGPQTREYGAFIIHSRETGVPRTIYGNVPNTGLITNLPSGCCVEVPCLVDSQGLRPVPVGDLPLQLAVLCQSNISTQALTVEAALSRKREHIYHAVMSDPNTAATLTLDKIWAMCDELIEAHQKSGLLGPFAPTIRGTGRSFAGTGDRVMVEIGYADGGKSFVAKISNGRSVPVALKLAVALQSWEGKVLARESLIVQAAAGQTTSNPIRLEVPSAVHQGFRVTAESSLHDALLIGLEAAPRKILYAGGKKPALEISLAGMPAVKGWINGVGSDLQFRFQVDDSKVTPHELPCS